MEEQEYDSSDDTRKDPNEDSKNRIASARRMSSGEAPSLTGSSLPSQEQFQTFLKLLVPSVAAGAVIGRKGETIAKLQTETNTRIKMSKARDFYPGTNERTCMIYGASPESIIKAYEFIASKMIEKPDLIAKEAVDYDTRITYEREKQLKVLVPNSTAGMIIGRSGAFVKKIKEDSGAYLQVSQKATEQTIPERCITVLGDVPKLVTALALILEKIFEDPHSGSCPNLSYANVVGPVPNFNPTGSPYAGVTSQACSQHVHVPAQFDPSSAYGTTAYGGGITTDPNTYLMQCRNSLRVNGFSDQGIDEILSALSTLTQYGLLIPGSSGIPGTPINMGSYVSAWVVSLPPGSTGSMVNPNNQNPNAVANALQSMSISGSPLPNTNPGYAQASGNISHQEIHSQAQGQYASHQGQKMHRRYDMPGGRNSEVGAPDAYKSQTANNPNQQQSQLSAWQGPGASVYSQGHTGPVTAYRHQQPRVNQPQQQSTKPDKQTQQYQRGESSETQRSSGRNTAAKTTSQRY